MKSVGAGPAVRACRLALPTTASSGYSHPAILGRSRNFQRKIIFLSAMYRDSGPKAELIPNRANGCAGTRGIRGRCSVNCGVNRVATPPTATGVFEPRTLLQRHSHCSKNRLETDVTLFSTTDLHPPVATHNRRISSDIAFGVWASIVLIALAMLSVAVGVLPVVDPQICVGC